MTHLTQHSAGAPDSGDRSAPEAFDEARAEAFGERMMEALNHGALVAMTSVGHRTGLFDALDGLPPSTSEAIAEAAGLDERYVREWLGAMTVSGVVEHDPEAGTYRLPPEHAACLTRRAAPDNVAAFAQYIPLFGTVEDGIVRCFREGGGLPYSAFPRFHEVMAEDSGQTVLPALFDSILPLVPGLTDRLEQGIEVLDLGCGVGKALTMMAERFPNSRFTGYDVSEEAIGIARRGAEEAGLDNLRFEVRDAATVADADRYDLVCTFDAIHDQVAPDRVLANIHRAVKPDGVYLMQDIKASEHVHENAEHPMGPFLYTISCFHCMTVSLSGGGAGLGAVWGVQRAERMLREAGFESVEVHELPHDPQNAYFINRPAR